MERDNKEPPADDYALVIKDEMNELETCSLILSSMGIEHLLQETAIYVRKDQIEESLHHIEAYKEENKDWPPQKTDYVETVNSGNLPTITITGGLILFFVITGDIDSKSFWFQAGMINSDLILKHKEWYRLITALTLHADLLHLAGNSLIGGVLFHILSRLTGYGMAWFLAILSGVCGNYLNIITKDTLHTAIGFSTSVFGIIGILCGQSLVRKKLTVKNSLIVTGAGLGLLALLGTSGENTDLGAHFFGLLSGFILGLATEIVPVRKLANNRKTQLLLFAFTTFLIIISWHFAMK